MKENDIIDLYDLLLEQMRDLFDGLNQKLSFLEQIDPLADSSDLDELILAQIKQAKYHKERLIHAFYLLDEDPTGETCKGIRALINSSLTLADRCRVPEVKDASLITSIQHINHYEFAGYGTSIAYTKILDRHDLAEILLDILRESKEADDGLSNLAETAINKNATWNSIVASVVHEEK